MGAEGFEGGGGGEAGDGAGAAEARVFWGGGGVFRDAADGGGDGFSVGFAGERGGGDGVAGGDGCDEGGDAPACGADGSDAGDGEGVVVVRVAHGVSSRPKMRVALAPPKPKELVRACDTVASRGVRMRSKVQTGSGSRMWRLGGSHWPWRAMRQMTDSTAPAPPRRWPMADLVELTGMVATVLAVSAAQRWMARPSAMSLRGVPVPCELM